MPTRKKRTISPQRQRIYRRRRIVIGVAALIALALVVFCIYSLSRGVSQIGATIGRGGSAMMTRIAAPRPSSASGIKDCNAGDISLQLSAKSPTAPVGGSFEFVVSIEHRGSGSCLVDGSDSSRVLTITSGNTTVWRSDVCPANSRMLLMAQGDKDVQGITWNADHTGGSCVADANLPRVNRGTYVAQVTLKGVPTVTSQAVPILVQ